MLNVSQLCFQERGIRSGTVPTPLAVGLGEACRIAMEEMEYDSKHISRLSKRFKAKIAEALEFVIVNGDTESSYPGTISSYQRFLCIKLDLNILFSFFSFPILVSSTCFFLFLL